MACYLLLRDIHDPDGPKWGAMTWDGETLRTWGILDNPPFNSGDFPSPGELKLLKLGSALVALLQEGSQFAYPYTAIEGRTDDLAAKIIEFDGYQYYTWGERPRR